MNTEKLPAFGRELWYLIPLCAGSCRAELPDIALLAQGYLVIHAYRTQAQRDDILPQAFIRGRKERKYIPSILFHFVSAIAVLAKGFFDAFKIEIITEHMQKRRVYQQVFLLVYLPVRNDGAEYEARQRVHRVDPRYPEPGKLCEYLRRSACQQRAACFFFVLEI